MPHSVQTWWYWKSCGSWEWAKQEKCRSCGWQAPAWAEQGRPSEQGDKNMADADGFEPEGQSNSSQGIQTD
eukprot:3024673-Amphidinium_carterae.2